LVVHFTNRKNAPFLFFHTTRDAASSVCSRKHFEVSYTLKRVSPILLKSVLGPHKIVHVFT